MITSAWLWLRSWLAGAWDVWCARHEEVPAVRLHRLFTVVRDDTGRLGIEIHDEDLTDPEALGIAEWLKHRILAGMLDDDEDTGGPPSFTVTLN